MTEISPQESPEAQEAQEAQVEVDDERIPVSFLKDPLGWLKQDWQGHEEGGVRSGRQAKVKTTAILAALAIAIHNFPEGLATFMGTLSDASVGVSLAIAIAIHNIPEGICVAVPIYYSTGSRIQAFLWAFLSGISEPVGALLGWAIIAV